ncbi:bacillithiol system redox-active protein YtxJ [Mesonia sp. K7]|uniref:bacillithiol system redox-active protein YtxJ n=1 Tax=Mesonia sp. K7 TaxID=2218606 RepID=UPI000DA8F2B4|nr:bacillithiol system redox-active protein YtxJ [Mesonia sp. K7]PZD78301.1 bacillithiol system redox-active protein YtxJ [Mesonia sp. K7]
MGFFDKIFGKSESETQEANNFPWNELTEVTQLDEIAQESNSTKVAIFKHSTRCGISRGVLKRFEKSFEPQNNLTKFYFLDLLNHRDISNEIAEKFGVPHESPQLIVLENGVVVHDASHNGIHLNNI